MTDYQQILKELKSRSNPRNVEGMARFGINPRNTLGVSMPELRKLGKNIGRDHVLALKLWDSGIHEARILAALIDEPKKVTESQMESWVKQFDSWDVCDQVCMNLFEKSPLVWKKIVDWSAREEEFVKRTAFALLACLAWHDKKAADAQFIAALPVINAGATDNRNFVKKAVNWALRNIGKRNTNLNRAALHAAREIGQMDSKAARWVAADAIRELESEAVQARLRE